MKDSFWDAHGVEIGACAMFYVFSDPENEENSACLNLDALSVPAALVQSIRILVAPAVVLAHQWLKS